MAIIRLQRTKALINLTRKYEIYIDENKVGTIANGETIEVQISAGKHKIFAIVDWVSSQEIDFYIKDTQTINFNINVSKKIYWLLLLVFGIGILGNITNSYHHNSLLIITVLNFGFLIYISTVGRKKYLTLDENIKSN